MSKPKDAEGLKQLATFIPKDVDDKLAEKAKAEGKTKKDLVTAALSAYVGKKSAASDEDE